MSPDIEYNRREADKRLDRIESKLDQIGDALQTLARTEEKIMSANKRLDVIERKMEAGYADHIKLLEAAKDAHMTSMILDRVVLRLDAQEEILDKLRLDTSQSNTFRTALEKAFWVIFTAVVGGVVYLFDRGGS